ncbi:hypothetical protein [Flagellimonas sp.]|uniref:hypothetical protein n=1 Tax=Flagellimonas sp. TaxID=2058762 RepID=UPI003BAC80DF
MKKAVVILVIVGLGLVGVAYYFSLESLKLMERVQEDEYLNEVLLENEMIADESAKEELSYGNTVIYQTIDLSKPEYAIINPCMKRFQAIGELDPLCLNTILDVVVDDFGEQGFINAMIGASIDYDNLALDHTYLEKLFAKSNSLANTLTLGFLNRYRNPSNLQKAFDRHKASLLKNVPKNLYQKVFEKQVDECLSAYKEIADQSNKEVFFEDIYFKADSQNLHGQYWKYTFWKRREIEKNDKIIHAILSEIKKYYDGQ